MKTFTAAAAAVLLLFCASFAGAGGIEIPFALAVGESAILDDAGLVVTFESILYEGRCPLTVVCVWEGVAEIRVSAGAPGELPEEVSLFTLTGQPGMFPIAMPVAGHIVELLLLEPYPMFPGPLQPDIYVATLIVHEAGSVALEDRSWSSLKFRHPR